MPLATKTKKRTVKRRSKLEANDKKRNSLSLKAKVKKVMHEFKHGELHSGKSGKKVTNPKQAIAIALSEGRKAMKKK